MAGGRHCSRSPSWYQWNNNEKRQGTLGQRHGGGYRGCHGLGIQKRRCLRGPGRQSMAGLRPAGTASAASPGKPELAITPFRIKVGDHWFTVQVGDLTYSPVEGTVEGETISVEVEGLPPRPPPNAHGPRSRPAQIVSAPRQRHSSGSDPSDKILRSPMPGKVIFIMVRPGDRVSAGDEVCVVEAMKMEQSIRTGRDGVIKAVHVQPMDSVSANDPLVELE